MTVSMYRTRNHVINAYKRIYSQRVTASDRPQLQLLVALKLLSFSSCALQRLHMHAAVRLTFCLHQQSTSMQTKSHIWSSSASYCLKSIPLSHILKPFLSFLASLPIPWYSGSGSSASLRSQNWICSIWSVLRMQPVTVTMACLSSSLLAEAHICLPFHHQRHLHTTNTSSLKPGWRGVAQIACPSPAQCFVATLKHLIHPVWVKCHRTSKTKQSIFND